MMTKHKLGNETENILKNSTFSILNGDFVYAKVKNAPQIDIAFMVAKDEDEITVVIREENAGSLDLIEKNNELYRMIRINVSVPFYSVGFLASISAAIANKGINILIISTYSRDYVMVRKEFLGIAAKALLALGLKRI